MAADNSIITHARAQRQAFRDAYLEAILADPKPPEGNAETDPQAPVYTLAALFTGKDLAGGNKRMREAMLRAAGKDKKFTPKEASKVKWHMRGLLRVYYLFYDKSQFFPGRLEPDVQAKMEECFFNYGCFKSMVHRVDTKFIWFIQGSENHDMMDLSNAYLALQTVYKKDAYKDRKLPDGHTAAEHVKAWEKYYALYALERAKNGLFVEISPTYGKWFVGELVNMFEFSESKVVRNRMEKLLHLTWADWAVDQLNGTRGGGKTRCYQGSYAQNGGGDSWDNMAKVLFGIKPWPWNSHGGLSTLALLTSKYDLPDVVLDIALGKRNPEPFVYQSGRPAKVTKALKNGPKEKGYWMDPAGGEILRYSYCTSDAIMGSWMLNVDTDYAAINSQNRWQGVVFSTGADARVFPQSLGLGNKKTYDQHLAVQHRNVMVVMNQPKAKQTGQMRVFFPKRIHDGVMEREGWVIVKEGSAWLGVRVLGSADDSAKNYEFRTADTELKVKEASRQNTEGAWIWPKADKPPVAFVLSREDIHKTPDDFLKYVKTHQYTFAGGTISYTFTDDLGKQVNLELSAKQPVPKIDGKPVNLKPAKVFDCLYLNSAHGSGFVTIQKDELKLALDFNEAVK